MAPPLCRPHHGSRVLPILAAVVLLIAPAVWAAEAPRPTIAGSNGENIGINKAFSSSSSSSSSSGAATLTITGATLTSSSRSQQQGSTPTTLTLTGGAKAPGGDVPRHPARGAAPGDEDADAQVAMTAALNRGSRANVLVTFRVPPQEGAATPASAAAARGQQQASGEADTAARLHALAALKRAVLSNVAATRSPESSSGRDATPIAGGSELRIAREFPQLPVSLVTLYSAAELQQLRAHPDVVSIEPDAMLSPALRESLPLIDHPLALTLAGADAGKGCTIAVIDSGVDYTIPELGSCTAPGAPPPCRVSYSVDVTGANDGQLDDIGHGTYVAAVAAAVAPGANIVSLDVMGPGGNATISNLLAAVDWVLANTQQYGICAAVMSLGGSTERRQPCAELSEAAPLAALRAKGIIVAVASGNNGFTKGLTRPACAPSAVSVGSVYDANLGPWDSQVCKDPLTAPFQVACYSNSASYLTMLAPGDAITVAGAMLGGTSMAAPFVAGAAAVLATAAPSATADQIVAALTAGGVPVRDVRNAVVKPVVDLGASVALLQGGMAVAVNGRAVSTSSRRMLLSITTLAAPPAGAMLCASDTSDNADSCCKLRPFVRALPYDITSPDDGPKTVHVFLRGGPTCAAPLLASASVSVSLDTQGPRNLSISIAGGANITTTPSVVVNVAADDSVDMQSMCVQTLAPGVRRLPACSQWGPYTPTSDVTLAPRTGHHRIRVSLRDGAGNVAAGEAAITLDNVAPRQRSGVRIKTPPKSKPVGQVNASLSLTWPAAKDVGVGLAGYILTYQQGSAKPPERCAAPPGSSVVRAPLQLGRFARAATVDGLAPGTLYTMRLCAVDAAGNVSHGVTISAKTPL